jgi:phosphate transport system substrate-binding protein
VRPRTLAWKRIPFIAIAFVAIIATACGKEDAPTASAGASPARSASSGGASASLIGAGSTFVNPAMTAWISKYKTVNADVSINYQAIGSGGGVTQLIAQTIDFADSDAFMKPDELSAAQNARKCSVVHVPMVFGAVTVAYNLKGVSTLTLDGPTLANIYLGKIKSYNDPAIKALNPGVTLPSTTIRVIHRSDASGTSNIFTTYLSSVSPTWASQVGASKSPKWPTGGEGQGNDGVAAQVQSNDGGLGYVELSYALDSNLSTAKLKNKDGNAIDPSIKSTQAAVQSLQIPADLRFNVTGVGGQGYPIVGATWVIAYECGYPPDKATALKDYLTWVINNGDAIAQQLHYAPLFPALKTKALESIALINSK